MRTEDPSDNKRIGLTGQAGPIPDGEAVAYFVDPMIDSDSIIERFASLSPHLDERGRRLFAAIEANSAGYGGFSAVRGSPAKRRAPSGEAGRTWRKRSNLKMAGCVGPVFAASRCR